MDKIWYWVLGVVLIFLILISLLSILSDNNENSVTGSVIDGTEENTENISNERYVTIKFVDENST